MRCCGYDGGELPNYSGSIGPVGVGADGDLFFFRWSWTRKGFVLLGRYHDASPNPAADAQPHQSHWFLTVNVTSSMIGSIAQISLRLGVKSGV